ncbi:hypothetical protein F511_35478 [Dorcoceras hygrometricum]|uniref:Uncharacterized protein n=1 Tax=Dorcoceras hygrometricum TaxID=472368 RepID=A0A2Z7AF15_9LAMI|nr:hypothetical protein F511_35478 [Dorcoceras hygrometricum]
MGSGRSSRSSSLLRPPLPEPFRLDHPQVQAVPTVPAKTPVVDHTGRTIDGKAAHRAATLGSSLDPLTMSRNHWTNHEPKHHEKFSRNMKPTMSHACTRTRCWGTAADPDHASRRGSGRTKFAGRRSIQFNTNMQAMTFIGCLSLITLLATRAWLRPVSRGNRHFTVDGGRLRQSGPRPDMRLLRQTALESLTRSARTDSPRQVGRNKFRRRRRRRREV